MDGLQKPTNAFSNGTIPDPPWPPLPRDWGFATGTGKATDFEFGGYIYMAIPKKNVKNFGQKWSVGVQGQSKFFGYPLLSRERVKLRISNLASTFTWPIRIKTRKKFEEKGAWAYRVSRDSPIFWVPPSQERIKLRTSNFEGTFVGWIGTKAHEKCWEKQPVLD